MAMQLARLSGIEPLSIDQTDIREESPPSEVLAHQAFRQAMRKHEANTQILQPLTDASGSLERRARSDTYSRLVAAFRPTRPIVLERIADHAPWSARPGIYDLNVILPRANPAPSDYSNGPLWLNIDGKPQAVLPPANGGQRPGWLRLDGQRVAVPIDSDACAQNFPCLVEAHYAAESTDAIAADRYLFLQKAKNVLYLRPGTFRLRTVDATGRTLNEVAIVAGPP